MSADSEKKALAMALWGTDALPLPASEQRTLEQLYKKGVRVVPLDTIAALRELQELKDLINTPELEDFDKGVPLEAVHQVQRWGAAKDDGKNPEDWFWLTGYLAGKALSAQKAGDLDKAKHHCISTAAALRNWHAHLRSGHSVMRPGIEDPTV